ncbi:hypothetical protein [Clostridium vincentii]|uniref:Uncharacterized protein n=1 Tax=Clostridium vincentii TaxID=52704 RepID=A0A2T0BFS4_9CLOT|nr:hypothetical protein [Clostridium vincentii]PRR82751.1 hypothetical protein CLVI_15610 [Clostridium vincentii]
MYYVCKESGEDGSFCSRCYDESLKLVRMHDLGNGFQCPIHTNIFLQIHEQEEQSEEVLW